MSCLNTLTIEELNEMEVSSFGLLLLEGCTTDGPFSSNDLSVRVCYNDYLVPECQGEQSKIFNLSPRVNP